MLKNKLLFTSLVLALSLGASAQKLSIHSIIDSVRHSHPVIKMYDNEIRAMDEAAEGARSWMAPQIGFGQFMTPYDVRLWHGETIS